MNTLQKRLRANPLPLPNVMDLCREAADRLDELEREVDALTIERDLNVRQCDAYQADAERYRWLCEPRTWPESVNAALDCSNKVMIDAAIDAARSKT